MYVYFEVPTAAIIQIVVLWVVTTCSHNYISILGGKRIFCSCEDLFSCLLFIFCETGLHLPTPPPPRPEGLNDHLLCKLPAKPSRCCTLNISDLKLDAASLSEMKVSVHKAPRHQNSEDRDLKKMPSLFSVRFCVVSTTNQGTATKVTEKPRTLLSLRDDYSRTASNAAIFLQNTPVQPAARTESMQSIGIRTLLLLVSCKGF